MTYQKSEIMPWNYVVGMNLGVCVCVLVAQLCLTLADSWTSLCIRIAHQTSLSIEFSRQEYWRG